MLPAVLNRKKIVIKKIMKIEKVTNMTVSFSVQYLSKKKYVRNIIKGQNMFNVELL